MAIIVTDSQHYADIASAIRDKVGVETKYKPSEMATAISAIETGGGSDSGVADAIIDRTITEIESDVSEVGANAFYNCKTLEKASFPYATTLGDNSLRDCTALTELYAPNAATLRGGSVRGCQRLVKLDFPKTRALFANVFTGCTRLETVIFRSETLCSMSNANVFQATPIADGTGYIYVPSALVDEYKAAANWSTYADQIRAIEDYPEITGGV